MTLSKQFLYSLTFSCFGFTYGQYGSLELSSGGFSFVPAFTDNNPNLILNAGTATNGLIPGHMIANVRMTTMNLRGLIFISRLKLSDKKFKLSAGIHLPVLQIDETFKTDSFFAQEVIASYPLSDKVQLSSMYIHGKGRNNDLEINLLTLNVNVIKGNFSFLSQLYLLDLDNTSGIAEHVNYKLTDKWDLRGFINYTLSENDFIWTLGLRRNF